MPPHLAMIAKRLKNVRIENRDALEMIADYTDRPATLLYLDPPYLATRTHGYQYEAADAAFHEKLLEAVLGAKCMVLISGYQNKLYKKMLTQKAGWRMQTIKTTTKGNDGVSHSREEVIWMNRIYRNAFTTGKVPIVFTPKEKENKKVNPTRRSPGRPKKRLRSVWKKRGTGFKAQHARATQARVSKVRS